MRGGGGKKKKSDLLAFRATERLLAGREGWLVAVVATKGDALAMLTVIFWAEL